MASNTNKRIPVKWVRDKAKVAYQKKVECFICGTDKELELHHLVSITNLLESWATKNGYSLETDAEVVAVREEFIEEHRKELFDWVYTLCNKHHVQLHSIYGKMPKVSSAPKQERWLQIQRDKANGIDSREKGMFSSLY